MKSEELSRFLEAQNQVYLRALAEVNSGMKQTHWMWFVFPQIKGLGRSEVSKFYAIKNLKEARAYLDHPVLGKNLIEISKAVLAVEGKTAAEIFGSPDDLKLCSSMTLFAAFADADPVFAQVINKYFAGLLDSATLRIIENDLDYDTI